MLWQSLMVFYFSAKPENSVNIDDSLELETSPPTIESQLQVVSTARKPVLLLITSRRGFACRLTVQTLLDPLN